MSMASGQRKLYNHIKLYYLHWGKTLFKNVGHDSVHTPALGVSLAASKTLFQNNFISSHIFSIYMISRSYYYCVLYSNYHNISFFFWVKQRELDSSATSITCDAGPRAMENANFESTFHSKLTFHRYMFRCYNMQTFFVNIYYCRHSL